MSSFTVVRSLEDRGVDLQFVFNTQTGRALAVRSSEWHAICEAMPLPAVDDPAIRDAIARLERDGYAVPQDCDEVASHVGAFEAQRRAPARIYPLLAVTSRCNIACTYCYEEGVEGKSMTPEVVAGAVRWMEHRVTDDNVIGVHPGLFGGEPLIRPKVLFDLMDGVNAFRDRYGVDTSFYSSSNGLLLTPSLAADLAARHLTQLQISIDGPERIHDLRRIGHGGQPTFARSLEAIRVAVQYIHNVTVKVNFDRQNRAFIGEVFDLLVTEGLADRVDVKLEAIAHQMPGSAIRHDAQFPIPPESEELADAYIELMLEARLRGIAVSRDTAHTTPCMFSSEHGVLIGPDGSIYKCISLVGRDEFAVGSVLMDEPYTQAYEAQMTLSKRIEDCIDERCAYLPVCGGGCAYESIVRTGTYERRFCTKEHLAEFHFKRHLMRNHDRLTAMGMRPLRAEELQPAPTHTTRVAIRNGRAR